MSEEITELKARVDLARGVVIPCEVSGNLWYVKIRCFDSKGRAVTHSGAKYGGPRGGRGALFGADHLQATCPACPGGPLDAAPRPGSARTAQARERSRRDGRPLLLCEGERDALLVIQELSDLVDVATLGGAGRRNPGHWALWLLPYRLILVAYDADVAGREGATYLTNLFERVQGIRVPHGEDLTGFHAGGGDLRAWLHCHVDRSGTSVFETYSAAFAAGVEARPHCAGRAGMS